jgi:hypothetical protein
VWKTNCHEEESKESETMYGALNESLLYIMGCCMDQEQGSV